MIIKEKLVFIKSESVERMNLFPSVPYKQIVNVFKTMLVVSNTAAAHVHKIFSCVEHWHEHAHMHIEKLIKCMV